MNSRRGLERNLDNGVLLDLQHALDRGESLFLKSFALERSLPSESTADALPSDPVLTGILRSGSARRLRFRLEHEIDTTAEALAELRRMLGEDPTFAYAELLAARYGVWESESNALPSFASAFEEALRAEDRAKLEQLTKFQPRLEALILVARAVLGDEDAALEVEAWLRAKPATREVQPVSTLRAGLDPILRVIEGGLSTSEALASHRETVVTTLHDANEASLDEYLLLAA
jgi:hypothetical protein